MSDRTGLLLAGSYGSAFLRRAIESGYVDCSQQLKRNNQYKSAVLQMFLLFDKVTLVDVAPTEQQRNFEQARYQKFLYRKGEMEILKREPSSRLSPYSTYGFDFTYPEFDFSKLKSTGLVDVLDTIESSREQFPAPLRMASQDQAMREYSMLLKPIILNTLMRDFSGSKTYKDILKECGANPRAFYSRVFDVMYSATPPAVDESLERTMIKFNQKYGEHIFGERPEDAQERKWSTRGLWLDYIDNLLNRLMTMLELSVTKNAVLMQNEFSVSGLRTEDSPLHGMEGDGLVNSYRILGVACEQIIGTLPKLESIDQVLNLKEKRMADIHRLRTALGRIEEALREGQPRAFEKATTEVKKASGELAFANSVQRVGRWGTYLLAPLPLVELLLTGGIPIAGIGAAAFGSATTLISHEVAKRASWVQVIR